MKNAEFIMAAFLNCCLVEKNNLFTETLILAFGFYLEDLWLGKMLFQKP